MRKKFSISVNRGIFNQDEIEILQKFGCWFEDLMYGRVVPTTDAQKHFIDVCKGEAEPQTEYELTWWKYCRRLEWEQDPNNQRAMGPKRRELDTSFGGARAWHAGIARNRGGFFNRRRKR